MSSVLRAQMAAVHVTLNLFQGPDPAGWMLKPVQHDVIPAELNSFVRGVGFLNHESPKDRNPGICLCGFLSFGVSRLGIPFVFSSRFVLS
jgi:hypothetical protein